VPTVPAPRRGRPPKHSRPILLNAASQVLIKRGYGDLRYRDVAEGAGVPVASLQHYFPNLAELRREALLHQVRTETQGLADEVSHIADPWDKLRQIVIVTIGQGDEPNNRAEWTLWLEYWRAAAHEAEIAEHCQRTRVAHLQLIESAIVAGVEDGVFRPAYPPQAIAQTILSMINGFGIQVAQTDDPASPEGAVAVLEATIRTLLAVDDAVPAFANAQSRLA
jgi:AcrR family transcriptional regulator